MRSRLAVCALLLAMACADPSVVVTPSDDTSAEPSGRPTKSHQRGPGPGGSQTRAPATTTPVPASFPTPTGSATPAFPFTVTVARACVTAGGVQRAHIRTVPDVQLTMMASYPDNSGPPTYNIVTDDQNTTGRYTWMFVVPPTQPAGDAAVLAVASRKGQEGGPSGYAVFRIEEDC